MKKETICPKCGSEDEFIATRWNTECLNCHTYFDEQREEWANDKNQRTDMARADIL